MGYFKDAKDGIKGAKELGDYHGGMPSIRGSFKDLAALSDDRGQGEILKVGTPAKAVAKGFATPSATEKFTMQIELRCTRQRASRTPVCTSTRPPAEDCAVDRDGSAGEDPSRRPDDDRGAVGRAEGRERGVGGDMNAAMAGIQNTYAGTADAAGRAYLAEQEAAEQQRRHRQRPRRTRPSAIRR